MNSTALSPPPPSHHRRPLNTAALSPSPPLTAQEFPSRLVLTDLRVLIVRMMQAPRNDRIDSALPHMLAAAYVLSTYCGGTC